MERPVETLAQRVKKVRKERGLSQVQLAKASGLKQPDISKIELGDISKTTAIARLAEALHVSVRWLETGEGSPNVIVIDGNHRLFGYLKDVLKGATLDTVVVSDEDAQATERSNPPEEHLGTLLPDERELIEAYRALLPDQRADAARELLERGAVAKRYRQHFEQILGNPPYRAGPYQSPRPRGRTHIPVADTEHDSIRPPPDAPAPSTKKSTAK